MYDFQKQADVDLKIIRMRQLKELHDQNNLESSPHIMVDQTTMEVEAEQTSIMEASSTKLQSSHTISVHDTIVLVVRQWTV